MNKIRIGIIGSGFMGRTTAETVTRYLNDVELIAIAGGSRAEGLAKEYHAAWEPTPDDLLARPDIDAVFIHSPHSAHAAQTLAAAQHGKHILLDKPMATSVTECDLMIAAAREAGVNLMIAFGQRFRTCNIVAREIIQKGTIGRVKMIYERILNSGGLGSLPPLQRRPENLGTLFAHGVHNIDRIRWFVGAEISSVTAHLQRDATSGNESSAMVLLGLSNGAMATLWESWEIAPPCFPTSASGAWIAGEQGNLDLDAYGQLRLGKLGAWQVVAEQAPIDWKGKGMLDAVRMEAYRAQGQEFLASIRERRPPSVTGEDGRAAVEVALAAYQSAAEGRTIHLRARGTAE